MRARAPPHALPPPCRARLPCGGARRSRTQQGARVWSRLRVVAAAGAADGADLYAVLGVDPSADSASFYIPHRFGSGTLAHVARLL